MSSEVSIFADLKHTGRARNCKVATIASELSEVDKKIFLDAVSASPEVWPLQALAREVTRRGKPISETPILNHRSKACCCFTGN